MVSSAFLAATVAAFLAAPTSVANAAADLTASTYDEATSGKTVFIKFYAPWCGHCKAMAADWDKLIEEYDGHEVAFVGSVDCTDNANDDICSANDVQGFPTLKYGSVDAGLEDYQGNRDYESLSKFAKEHITKPMCSILKPELCSEEEQKDIKLFDSYDEAKLKDAAEAIKSLVLIEEKKFDAAVDKLQAQYEQMTNDHNAQLDKIKDEHKYKILSMVMKKKGVKMPELDDMDEDDDDDDDDDNLTGGEL